MNLNCEAKKAAAFTPGTVAKQTVKSTDDLDMIIGYLNQKTVAQHQSTFQQQAGGH